MQHEPLKPTKSASPAPRAARSPESDAAHADPAPAELLQRTIGNRATGALLGVNAAPPSADSRSVINSIVQRHPIAGGVHSAHGPKDKRHTPEEASAALVEAQDEWTRVGAEVALDVVPKRLNKTNSVVPKLTAMQKYVEARLSIAESAPIKATRVSLRAILEEVQNRLVAVKVRVENIDRAAGYDEALALANTVPNLLVRVEANARAGASALRAAVLATTGKEAKTQLEEIKHDLSGAVELTSRIDNIEGAAAKHADLLTIVQAHKVAATAAVNGLRGALTAVTPIHAALKALDSAKQTLDATRLLAATVDAKEKKLNDLEAHLIEETEYVLEFESTLTGMSDSFGGGRSAESMMKERREYLAAVTEARDQARLDLQAAKDAAGRIAAEEQLVTNAEQGVPPTKVGVDATGAAEITRLDDIQKLRAKAGGQPILTKLQASVPDNAKLEGLLDALGSKLLQAWLADGLIGSAKTIALYDALGGAALKKLTTDVGDAKRDAVMRAFSAIGLLAIHDGTQLGVPKFVELMARYTVDGVARMVTSMTLPNVKALTQQFSDTELSNSKLTADQWIDLHTKFTAVKLKHWYTTFGDESILDFLTKYTAATLNTFVTTVTEPRFEVLVRDKELKADALAHYGAAFLKDFAGVTGIAMGHLMAAVVRYNDDGNGNRISGGHDPTAFNAALNTIITPAVAPVMNGKVVVTPGKAPVRAGRSFNATPVGTECTKVDYELHGYDGLVLGGGQKTLINTLAAQQAAWQDRANEAIWGSIKDMTCNTATRRWSGTSAGGIAFAGYLAMDLKSVATFYPS